MADKRYKLLKRGLPGRTNFNPGDIDDGDTIEWDDSLDPPGWVTVPNYQLAEANPTGLIDGGELNIGPGANDVEVIAGSGIIIDSYTFPSERPIVKGLIWPQINEAITASPSTAGSLVWLTITDSGTPSVESLPGGQSIETNIGTLKQYSVPPSEPERRDEIFLGVLIHNGDVWGEISSPSVINNSAHTLMEFLKRVAGPTFVIDGGEIEENPGFTVGQKEGTVWEHNRNWHVDKKNPHREALPASSALSFKYVNRDFTDVSAATTVIDPTQWDDSGTVSTVPNPGNTATVQQLYQDPRDNYWILWGQQVFDNATEAAASVATLTDVPVILQASVLLGYIVVEKGQADWDVDEAFIVYPQGTGGGGGGSIPITTFLQLVDTPADYVGDKRKVAKVDDSETFLEFDFRNRYISTYIFGNTYYPQEWVSDGAYIAICNTETDEFAFPTPVGDLDRTYPDVPPFLDAAQVALVRSGHFYTFDRSGEVRAIRVWVPEVTPDTTYSLVVINDPNGTPATSVTPLLGLTAGQWNLVRADSVLYPAGSEVLVYIESQNSAGSNQVTGGWTRGGNDNANPPAANSWNRNTQHTVVRIDDTDLDTVNRRSELEGIVAGSTIQFVETAAPDNSATYRVESVNTGLVGYVEYTVVLLSTGVEEPTVGQNTTMTADIPIPQSTQFSYQTDKWLTDSPPWATITSFLQYDDVTQPVSNNIGYGIDISFQELTQSAFWNLIPLGSSGGGGGGETPAPGGGGSTEVTISQTAHGFAIADCIRYDGSNWVKALANDINTTALGVVIEIIDVNTFKYAITGRYSHTHGLAPDEWYFLSATTAGGLEATEPDLSQPIVYTDDATHFSVYAYRPAQYSPEFNIDGGRADSVYTAAQRISGGGA